MSFFDENSITQILENELTQMFENLTIRNDNTEDPIPLPQESIRDIFNRHGRRYIDLSNNVEEPAVDRDEQEPTAADYYQLLREYNRNIYEYENNIDNLTNLTRTTNLMLSELTTQYNHQLSVYQRNVNFILNSDSPSSVLSNFSEDYNNILLNYQWNMEHFLDILRQLYMNTTQLTQNYTSTIRNYQNNINRFYGRHFNQARNMNDNTRFQPPSASVFRTPRRTVQRRNRLIVPRNRPPLLLNNPPTFGVSTTTIPVGRMNLPTFSPNRQYLDLLNLIFTNDVGGAGTGESDQLPPRLSRTQIEQATCIIHWDSSMNETHCPITWEDFTEGEEIRQIRRCYHIFKNTALLNWLRTHNICPVCRYDLRTFHNTSSANNGVAEENETAEARSDEEENDFADIPDLLPAESNEENGETENPTPNSSYNENTYQNFLNMIRNLTHNENIIPDFTTQDSSGNYVAQYSFEFYPRT